MGLPSGSTLEPIATPLVFSGFQSATLQQFAPQIQGYGFVAAQGGTAAPRPDDKHLAPGDMAGNGVGNRRRVDQFGMHGYCGTRPTGFFFAGIRF